MKESDLYLPLKRLLESQHYEVKGEVLDCDVLAVRGEELPVVIELKVTLNLDVILQAVERLSLTPKVYICIPRECGVFKRRRKHTIKLLRMLGLGLVVVHPNHETGSAEVLFDPGEYTPRKSKPRQERLLGEFRRRVGDPNLGGAEKRLGIITAYRQRALEIARFLQEQGPTKASHIAQSLREPKARDFLYRDVYGWFDRTSLGVYDLSPRGRREIALQLLRRTRTMMLRPAKPSDVPGISALLDAVKLPTRGVADHIDTFIVSESDGAIIGVGGLEVHGAQALLRSLAVSPAHQGRGLAKAICDHLEAEAARRGIPCLYLLTETAEQFFTSRGYAAVPRSEAPPEIATSEEFSAICPQSAAFMRRTV